MSTFIFNEETKLFANALDRLSTACFSVGVLAPVAGAYFSPPGATSVGFGWCCVAYLIAGAIIHMLARRVVRGFRS